ncbi:hypothetical protein COCVIDRAFT_18161 [Bipolaris victoriae FI3]|uniref:Uncharacterized protein n=1 Tax=Bipolaris victoriae (strain FI3) TaxID=930091 RepID=W7E2F4_BIPV3|nr:hypothetical protein COCVIDRAFT_18161 [Bipolaris victoriae FI3]
MPSSSAAGPSKRKAVSAPVAVRSSKRIQLLNEQRARENDAELPYTGKGKGKARQVIISDDDESEYFDEDLGTDVGECAVEDEADEDGDYERVIPDSEDDDDDDDDEAEEECAFRTKRDWVLDPDYNPIGSEELLSDEEIEEIGDQELLDDEETEGIPAVTGEGPSQGVYIPPRFRFVSDKRCGITSPVRSATASDRKRFEAFDNKIRLVVSRLKMLTQKHSMFTGVLLGDKEYDTMTCGFAKLLEQSDKDFLVESFLNGVPESTKRILGQEQFGLHELKSLPRLSDSELSEKGIYIDIVEMDGEFKWDLYVGSAVAEVGMLQRWYGYLTGVPETSYHGKKIAKPGNKINLRCLAHFGHDPEVWLTSFAESLFMLYLGTVYDPRKHWNNPDYSSMFINDEIYNAVSEIRKECGLVTLEARGMNRTWSLIQGWRGVAIKSGAQCHDCGRIVPDRRDESFKRTEWTHIDPARPSSTHVTCLNCVYYKRIYGKARTPAHEARRAAVAAIKKHPNPGKCEYKGCTKKARSWVDQEGHQKWYCSGHWTRATNGKPMDAPFIKNQTTKPPRATYANPGQCEYPGCESKKTVHWCSLEGHKRYYCATHTSRAHNGKPMDAAIVQRKRGPSATYKNPGRCEYPGCTITKSIKWRGMAGHLKFYSRTATTVPIVSRRPSLELRTPTSTLVADVGVWKPMHVTPAASAMCRRTASQHTFLQDGPVMHR